MSRTAYLPKGKERDFLQALAERYRVYAPCSEDGNLLFRNFSPDCEISFDRPAVSPPKAVIYPQHETLFTFAFKKDPDNLGTVNVELKEPADFPATVIVGARPCDARGFTIIDRVFKDSDVPDPYYRARREATTIVSITCPSPWPGCFCTAVDGGPDEKSDSDAMMTELEKGYFLESVTEKGEKLLDAPMLEDGSPYREEAEKRQAEGRKAVEAQQAAARLPQPDAERFHSPEFWEEAVAKCVSCGACTYLCPTCYCFNITDEERMDSGERVRSWDSCMSCHFTLEASGHNPRTRKTERFKNRVGHKFLYYPEKYGGAIQCSGCGRCIRHCPVSMEISRIVTDLGAPEQKAGQGEEKPGA
jgi:sulfhydrogenase subunit beta (sulfur reductase)